MAFKSILLKFPKQLLKHLSKRKSFYKFISTAKALYFRKDLTRLGYIFQTDKVGSHFYTEHYNYHFNKFRKEKVNLLEIGVGGYSDPAAGGNSLKMWKSYFPYGKINAIDLYDKSSLQEKGIKIFQGDQTDSSFLEKVIGEIGKLDIIIDDGSHINEHVIETFKILFPQLKDNGIYVVEDTQTSYWSDYGGDSENLNNPKTLMNFFKGLTDSLNHKEILREDYQQTYFDKKIVSIHFYHNLIFVYKGNNNEESNLVRNNRRRIK